MDWMQDTLKYLARDPAYRRDRHAKPSFGLAHGRSDSFLLPWCHAKVMGNEYGRANEWNCGTGVRTSSTDVPLHGWVRALVRDLNRLHRECPRPHQRDFTPHHFKPTAHADPAHSEWTA